MSAPNLPAFDPESADAEILEAFEKIRAHRAWAYGFDDMFPGESSAWSDEQAAAWEAAREAAGVDAAEDEQLALESTVFDNWPTTPAGVAAQLALAVTTGCSERWIDRGLAEHGILALYQHTSEMDGHDRRIVDAACALLHMQWEQALARWVHCTALNAIALNLRAIADGDRFASPKPDDAAHDRLPALIDELDAAIGELDALQALMRTPAPDWQCYKHKAEIAVREEFAKEASPWLLRDVNMLLGAIIRPAVDAPPIEAKAA